MTIYVITNLVNGKQYVGQTSKSVAKRWAQHRWDAAHGVGCRVLQSAILKYGKDAFVVEKIPLPKGSTHEDLNAAERDMIARLGTLIPRGYNIDAGGGEGPRSAETCAAISDRLRGGKRTDEQRARLSAAHMGIGQTAETRAKISATMKGRKLGRPLSQEHRDKLSAVGKLRTTSEQTRIKLRAAQRNAWVARKQSSGWAAEIERMRETMREWWAKRKAEACHSSR